MKNLFKILLGLFLIIFAISCSKDDGATAVVAEKQDVVFDITNVVPQVAGKNAIAGKNNEEFTQCSDEAPAYAIITIDNVEHTIDVYSVGNKLYTNSIKLDVGSYTVNDFLLYDAGNQIIMATPNAVSDYAVYVNKTVDFNFNVTAFEKAEIPVEVLCFDAAVYDNFGFDWFGITQIAVREACFFGDICLNGDPFAPADFNGSAYGNNVGVDVTAIMKIIVKRNGVEVPNSPFKNIDALNSPLCVQYPDILNVDDEFTFELQLWLPDGNGFSYQTYATYTATDDGALDINSGNDGIVDFVVGTCGYGGVADATFDFQWTPPCFTQGFEVDTEGWLDQNSGWYGLVTRVASGNNGITSSNGNYHAIFEDDGDSAPFTRFCGYSDTWTGTWTAEIDVYLDTAWTNGEGFDYTVAANGSDNNHQRDYMFHVGVVDGNLLVNGSNNTDATFNSYKLLNENTGNYYTVASSGWYTLQQKFYDAGGYLAVDLNLIDSSGTTLWTVTRSTTTDLIPSEVGGNRYGWFTFISVNGGIAVDETKLVRS